MIFLSSRESTSSNSYTTNFVNKISDRLSLSAYIGPILSVIRILVKPCTRAPLFTVHAYLLNYAHMYEMVVCKYYLKWCARVYAIHLVSNISFAHQSHLVTAESWCEDSPTSSPVFSGSLGQPHITLPFVSRVDDGRIGLHNIQRNW